MRMQRSVVLDACEPVGRAGGGGDHYGDENADHDFDFHSHLLLFTRDNA